MLKDSVTTQTARKQIENTFLSKNPNNPLLTILTITKL